MKKYLFFCLSVICFVLISCSDEEYMHSQNNIFPKTLHTKYPSAPSQNFLTTIVYDGSKILMISNEKEKIKYLYEGSYIVKETRYKLVNGREVEYSETSYEYENEDLKTVNVNLSGKVKKYVYSYKSDGTILKETYDFDNKTEKEFKNSENKILTFVRGNLTNSVFSWGFRDIVSTSRYDYDERNNAFKNVLGFSKLLDQINFESEQNISSSNNLKKYDVKINYVPDMIFEPCSYNMEYEYNKSGYPTKKTIYDYKGEIEEIVEYSY
ncbi:hypothetical protein EDB96_1100 [Flavobacterium sp. S87F.05.LMB.W.Kidney.N]|nr:hypothetical protein EDB96_1100 [Flavobacterium sp. S87F.05.LMB.W.Kidney.N]